MTTPDLARLIAYHDTTCPDGRHCREDISTYPTPPHDWLHTRADRIEKETPDEQ